MPYRKILYTLLLLCLSCSNLNAKVTYKYSYIPKKIYENQLFPVTIIGIGEKKNVKTQFIFDKRSPTQPLLKKPLIVKNKNSNFYTFYFKAKKEYISLPQLFISSSESLSSLSAKNISISTLTMPKNFSHIIATDMEIFHSQVSYYDDTHKIITLSIKALEANIEEMNLSNSSKEYGIDEIERNFAKVTANVYAIIPSKQKELIFTYFNTIRKQFVSFNLSMKIEDSSVTTQSELNPKEDSFKKLKKYTLISLIIFFLLMAIIKKDFFYLIIVVISIITLLSLYVPNKHICIKQGAPLYIIPTNTSTISTYIDKKQSTFLLDTKNKYHKIAYKKDIIGWIKDEDVCKN